MIMKNWIYTEMLFCDEENAADICEYEEMLSLVKEFSVSGPWSGIPRKAFASNLQKL